jgi:hypothetical protein
MQSRYFKNGVKETNHYDKVSIIGIEIMEYCHYFKRRKFKMNGRQKHQDENNTIEKPIKTRFTNEIVKLINDCLGEEKKPNTRKKRHKKH